MNWKEDLRRNSKENMKLEHTSKKLSMEVKELKELVVELKIDIVEKETRLDHLHRINDELTKTMEEIIAKFKVSSTFSKITNGHYAVGFEEFHQDAKDHFPEVDFSPIRLHIAGENSILVSASNDVDVEDDTSTTDDVVP